MIQAKKKPTPKDLEVLSYLNSYPHLSGLQIQKMAEIIDHRDCILRLRNAGYPIHSWRVNYVNENGKHRWYMQYKIIQQAA